MNKKEFFHFTVPARYRDMVSLDKCRFLFSLSPPHARPFIFLSVLKCRCGLPLFYYASQQEKIIYGTFCTVCSFEGLLCRD